MLVEDQIVDEVVNDEVIEEQEIIENSDISEENKPENVQDEEDDEEDRVVTIGEPEHEDAEEPEEAPPVESGVIRNIRKANRKQASEIKALKRQIEANKKAAEIIKPVELGVKPTLSSCNFDDKKFEEELLSYHDRKRKVDEQASQKAKTIEEQDSAYRARQELYISKKKEHGFKDMADAEELVTESLSETQQGIIIQAAEDAGILVYALGKNPKKLEELSKIANPIVFTYKLAQLESQLRVNNKKIPSPEKRITGGKSGISGSSDKKLEQLRRDADKNGDYTKVAAYRRKLREKE